MIYKVDVYYDPVNGRGILWNDSKIGIDWHVSIPIMSDKDSNLPLLNFTNC